jgi:hypothetical protein
LNSARAVARHRGVTLEPVAPRLAGYGERTAVNNVPGIIGVAEPITVPIW